MTFQAYMTREFIRFVVIILSFFSLMYCLIDFLERNARYFPKYNTPGSVIIEYYCLQMPKMFVDLLPFATLFSAIITLWLFSRSGEIAAARSSGASVFTISAPLFAAGAILSILSFTISELVVPSAQTKLRIVETVKIEKSKLNGMFFDSKWIRSGNGVLHFKGYDRIRGLLKEPILYTFTNSSELSSVVRSENAGFDAHSKSWILENAFATKFDTKTPEKLETQFYERYDSRIEADPPRMISSGIQPMELGFFELRELIQESEKAGISAQKRVVDLYQKLSQPLASFLFIFLSLPFAMRRERQAESYAGIIVSLLLAMVFWVGNFSLRSFAQSEILAPWFAAAFMPVALLAFGIFQLKRLNVSI
jgi:LPS export ABC transporter permease LptG